MVENQTVQTDTIQTRNNSYLRRTALALGAVTIMAATGIGTDIYLNKYKLNNSTKITNLESQLKTKRKQVVELQNQNAELEGKMKHMIHEDYRGGLHIALGVGAMPHDLKWSDLHQAALYRRSTSRDGTTVETRENKIGYLTRMLRLTGAKLGYGVERITEPIPVVNLAGDVLGGALESVPGSIDDVFDGIVGTVTGSNYGTIVDNDDVKIASVDPQPTRTNYFKRAVSGTFRVVKLWDWINSRLNPDNNSKERHHDSNSSENYTGINGSIEGGNEF